MSLPRHPRHRPDTLAVYPHVSAQSLHATVESSSRRALQYERRLKDLESKLAEHLSNFRAVDGLLQDALLDLRRQTRRADKALQVYAPEMKDELDHSHVELSDLLDRLPHILTQIAIIRQVYDSGRLTAQDLLASLEWLNTPLLSRLRTVIFSNDVPVSWRWKTLARAIFWSICLVSVFVLGAALWGAFRAHKQRLVWGERLIS